MSDASGPEAGIFELTVLGGLGPSLEAALAPSVSHGLEATTVVLLHRDDDVDLVEAYGALVRNGLDVTEIIRVE